MAELANRQVRICLILLIATGLSVNYWHPQRAMAPDEAAFLMEELDILIDEELAKLRATRKLGAARETRRGCEPLLFIN